MFLDSLKIRTPAPEDALAHRHHVVDHSPARTSASFNFDTTTQNALEEPDIRLAPRAQGLSAGGQPCHASLFELRDGCPPNDIRAG
jgi:hypothetical protein